MSIYSNYLINYMFNHKLGIFLICIILINLFLEYNNYIKRNLLLFFKQSFSIYKKKRIYYLISLIIFTIIYKLIFTYILIFILISVLLFIIFLIIHIIFKIDNEISITNMYNIPKLIGFVSIYLFKNFKFSIHSIIRLIFIYVTQIYFIPFYVTNFIVTHFNIIRFWQKKGCKRQQLEYELKNLKFNLLFNFSNLLYIINTQKIIIKQGRITFNPRQPLESIKYVLNKIKLFHSEQLNTSYKIVIINDKPHGAIQHFYNNLDTGYIDVFTSKKNIRLNTKEKYECKKITDEQYYANTETHENNVSDLNINFKNIYLKTTGDVSKIIIYNTLFFFDWRAEHEILSQSDNYKKTIIFQIEKKLPFFITYYNHKCQELKDLFDYDISVADDALKWTNEIHNELELLDKTNIHDFLIKSEQYLINTTTPEFTNFYFNNIKNNILKSFTTTALSYKFSEEDKFKILKVVQSLEQTKIKAFDNLFSQIEEIIK